MNGKGDKSRTSDTKRYEDNYEKIFNYTTTSSTKKQSGKRLQKSQRKRYTK